MAKDPIRQASSKLFQALTGDPAAAPHLLGPATAGFDGEAAAAVAALQALSDALNTVFQDLIAKGDVDGARPIKLVMDQVAAVLIGINRAVIDYLDKAADVAAAQARLDGAVADLKQAEANVEAAAATMGDVTAVLKALTTLVGL